MRRGKQLAARPSRPETLTRTAPLPAARIRSPSLSALTANDLKTRGIAAIESALAEQPEATISVRGKDRFVVMRLEQYHHLRECELDAALAEARADMAAGRTHAESVDEHVARLDRLIAAEPGPRKS